MDAKTAAYENGRRCYWERAWPVPHQFAEHASDWHRGYHDAACDDYRARKRIIQSRDRIGGLPR